MKKKKHFSRNEDAKLLALVEAYVGKGRKGGWKEVARRYNLRNCRKRSQATLEMRYYRRLKKSKDFYEVSEKVSSKLKELIALFGEIIEGNRKLEEEMKKLKKKLPS